MTNFDEWKQNLTLDDMVNLRTIICENCPFDAIPDNCRSSRDYDDGPTCQDVVREWGRMEAQG